jgi:hypothetical protein
LWPEDSVWFFSNKLSFKVIPNVHKIVNFGKLR